MLKVSPPTETTSDCTCIKPRLVVRVCLHCEYFIWKASPACGRLFWWRRPSFVQSTQLPVCAGSALPVQSPCSCRRTLFLCKPNSRPKTFAIHFDLFGRTAKPHELVSKSTALNQILISRVTFRHTSALNGGSEPGNACGVGGATVSKLIRYSR